MRGGLLPVAQPVAAPRHRDRLQIRGIRIIQRGVEGVDIARDLSEQRAGCVAIHLRGNWGKLGTGKLGKLGETGDGGKLGTD